MQDLGSKIATEDYSEVLAKYRSVFDSIELGFCILKPKFDEDDQPVDFTFLEVNSSFESHSGIKAPIGKSILEIDPSYDRTWIRNYGNVALSGEILRIHRFLASRERWFEVYAFRTGDPEERIVAALFKDITEQKKIEDSLKLVAEADNFRVTLSDAIRPLTTPDEIEAKACEVIGRHLGANRVHYSEVVGDEVVISQAYLDGLRVSSGRHALADYPSILRKNLAGKTFFTNDHLCDPQFDDAEHLLLANFPIQAFAVVPLLKDGNLIAQFSVHFCRPHIWTPHQLSLVQETVERTWLALERARAEEALREADRRKDQFLATLAHELRNPLAPLRTGLQLMQLQKDDVKELTKTRIVMERQVNHMVRLIDDLLDVSRISRGKVSLNVEQVDLGEVVRHAIEISLPQLEANEQTLEIQIAEKPITLTADPTRLAQAISNLLNNAAKYSNKGAIVRLEVDQDQSDAVIRVIDQGIGIDPKDLPVIFEMFSQVGRDAARSQNGLGIGLHLVQNLITLHGGTVTASSEGLGQGTTFTIRLPLS